VEDQSDESTERGHEMIRMIWCNERNRATWRTGLRAEVIVVAGLALPAAALARQSAELRAGRCAAAESNAKSDLLGTRLRRASIQV